MFPAASRAVTAMVWSPFASTSDKNGDWHGKPAPPSKLHRKSVGLGSMAENWNSGVDVSKVTPFGSWSGTHWVSGAVVSTLNVSVAPRELSYLSVARTTKLC